VAVQSEAWTVFIRWNAGIVDSNPSQGAGVYIMGVNSVLCRSVYR
jgi:hypothetical protein